MRRSKSSNWMSRRFRSRQIRTTAWLRLTWQKATKKKRSSIIRKLWRSIPTSHHRSRHCANWNNNRRRVLGHACRFQVSGFELRSSRGVYRPACKRSKRNSKLPLHTKPDTWCPKPRHDTPKTLYSIRLLFNRPKYQTLFPVEPLPSGLS